MSNRDNFAGPAKGHNSEGSSPSAGNSDDPGGLQSLYRLATAVPIDMVNLKSFVRKSYSLRRYDLLETCLKELLKTYPAAKELSYLLASCLFEQGKIEAALSMAEELATAHPDYEPPRLLLDQVRTVTAGRTIFGANGTSGATRSDPAAIPGPLPRLKLLVGPGLYDATRSEAPLLRALRKVADVKIFDHTHDCFETVLRRLPAGWNPDAVLIRDSEYYPIPPGLETADQPVFCLLGDYNLSFNQMLPIMGAFDHFFCDLKGVRIFNKLGFRNCEYFCLYGYDPEVHRDYGLPKEYDVLFIGNLNHSVQQEREALLYRLARLGKRYRVHIATNIFGPEYAMMLNRSTLVFNRPIRCEINMRFFEALACGALVLNPHIEELDMLGFFPGKHYLAYDRLEETIDEYVGKWSESRKREAQEDLRHVIAGHSYDNRACELVQRISEIRVNVSGRGLRSVGKEEASRRWEKHRSNGIEVAGLGHMDRFDPRLVAWQTYMVNNELEIRNFDFKMWTWWMELLAVSGLRTCLAGFLDEKEQVLEAFGCYTDIAAQIRELKKTVSNFNFFADPLQDKNFGEMDRGRMAWR